jgi:hypothetical protein
LAESRTTAPIFRLELFRNRIFSVASAIGFVIGLALFGTVRFTPLYLQVVKGNSPNVVTPGAPSSRCCSRAGSRTRTQISPPVLRRMARALVAEMPAGAREG